VFRYSGGGDQRRSSEIVTAMLDLITSVLGFAAWVGGVLVLVLMAALPLLEHFGEPGRGR
jgi:hypothetical protein